MANVSDKLIVIGMGTCGLASGARGVLTEVEQQMDKLSIHQESRCRR
jgi:hypothetical protein